MGEAVFDEIIQSKVQPITGDIISPDLSLSDQDREMIINSVQVFIHCAATLDYHERLDLALEVSNHERDGLKVRKESSKGFPLDQYLGYLTLDGSC